MFDYDPKYDMPPRISKFIDRHPWIIAVVIVIGVLIIPAIIEAI